MKNERKAWLREDGVIAFFEQPEIDKQGFKWFPLYTPPVKYCPSEDNAAYEKGFIDGMAKMTESAVHCAVEGMAVKELTDEEILQFRDKVPYTLGSDLIEFARAILRKAQEK